MSHTYSTTVLSTQWSIWWVIHTDWSVGHRSVSISYQKPQPKPEHVSQSRMTQCPRSLVPFAKQQKHPKVPKAATSSKRSWHTLWRRCMRALAWANHFLIDWWMRRLRKWSLSWTVATKPWASCTSACRRRLCRQRRIRHSTTRSWCKKRMPPSIAPKSYLQLSPVTWLPLLNLTPVLHHYPSTQIWIQSNWTQLLLLNLNSFDDSEILNSENWCWCWTFSALIVNYYVVESFPFPLLVKSSHHHCHCIIIIHHH